MSSLRHEATEAARTCEVEDGARRDVLVPVVVRLGRGGPRRALPRPVVPAAVRVLRLHTQPAGRTRSQVMTSIQTHSDVRTDAQ